MARAKITTAQVRMIRSIVHGRLGWDNDQYHDFLAARGGPASTLDLGRAEAANLIDCLQDLAAGRWVRVWTLDQATLRQREEIARLAGEAGVEAAELGGVIRRATYQRVDLPELASIHEAIRVIEALRAIARRRSA